MTSAAIIRAIVRERFRVGTLMPNFTPRGWWECDVFELTGAGYFTEYEVKVSRSDFRADSSKARRTYIGPVTKKHDMLSARSKHGPVRFYFCTPVGLIEQKDLPEWAGLIEFRETADGEAREERGIDGPRLHGCRAANTLREQALLSAYYRFFAKWWL